jgi:hypothetical protein
MGAEFPHTKKGWRGFPVNYRGAGGLVFRQVGTAFVAPNSDGGRVYDPIDGAVTVPIGDRDIPIVGRASAAVPERANTVARIIVNFMAGSFLFVR